MSNLFELSMPKLLNGVQINKRDIYLLNNYRVSKKPIMRN